MFVCSMVQVLVLVAPFAFRCETLVRHFASEFLACQVILGISWPKSCDNVAQHRTAQLGSVGLNVMPMNELDD